MKTEIISTVCVFSSEENFKYDILFDRIHFGAETEILICSIKQCFRVFFRFVIHHALFLYRNESIIPLLQYIYLFSDIARSKYSFNKMRRLFMLACV